MTVRQAISPDEVTIAITVYSRKQFIKRAIGSALDQTMPVRVIVVEDCGPDPTLQEYVKQEFGGRIEYFRNPKRRGLFGNWNACIEHCRTKWLSILHDDDYLARNFIESAIRLSKEIPGCGLYFGYSTIVDEHENPQPLWKEPLAEPWRIVAVEELYKTTPFPFPGQLFRVDLAREFGGFRVTSQYAGDWEMWAKLTAYHGAAETQDHVAYNRGHAGFDRGSNLVRRTGRIPALTYVQRKRVVALAKHRGVVIQIDRRRDQAWMPLPSRDLLDYGATISPRLLGYNLALLKLSPSVTWGHAMFKLGSSLLGPVFVRLTSKLWNWARISRSKSVPQGVRNLRPDL
jgi:glycosyltransferase involved in cell wall biosynthesis